MKKIQLITTALLAIALCPGCDFASAVASQQLPNVTTAAGGTVSLTDIKQHWAKVSIEKAVAKGYVEGYENGTFRPDIYVSRAEFVKMLITAMKLAVKGDASGAMWFVPFANAAKSAGIFHDEDFSINDMNQSITRLEMARLSERVTDKTLQDPIARIDDASVMYNSTKKGLIQGLGAGELGPDKLTTRAQSVTIIERILTVQGGGLLSVDKYAAGNAELALKKTNMFTVAPEIFGYPQYVRWDPSNLFIESEDKKYKGVIDAFIVIDMSDPNDPNRGLLGNVDELHWLAQFQDFSTNPLVKDYPQSYIIVLKMHNEVNQDPEKYVADHPSPSLGGFVSPDNDKKQKGDLNTLAAVYRKKPSDTQAYILPKTGLNSPSGDFLFRVQVPTREAEPASKSLFGITIPKQLPAQ